MKYRTVLILLSLILLFMLFAAVASLITNIILGYSGFKNIKSKENLVMLQTNCTNTYFTQKYNQAFSTSKQIIFICNLVLCATVLISLLFICCFLKCCRKNENGRQQTRIEQLQSAQNQREQIESYYPTIWQVIPLFILIAISIMASFIGSYTYLRVLLDGTSNICIVTYNKREILALCILYFVIFALGISAFIIILFIAQRQRKRDQMVEAQIQSISYRDQIERIIREIPQSERRFTENQERRQMTRELERLPNATNSQRNRPQQLSQHVSQNPKIDNVQRVKSIIYQVDPELMLESIAQGKQ